MTMLEHIKEGTFLVCKDSVIGIHANNGGCQTADLGSYPEISQTIKPTKENVSDACFLTRAKFIEKYEDSLLEKAPYTVSVLYSKLREVIVDEKVSVKKLKARKKEEKKSIAENPQGLSRAEQVKVLFDEGVTSPSKIAKQIGAHPSYVSQILKKLRQ